MILIVTDVEGKMKVFEGIDVYSHTIIKGNRKKGYVCIFFLQRKRLSEVRFHVWFVLPTLALEVNSSH